MNEDFMKENTETTLQKVKRIIDGIIPTCGEKDCDVCDERHLRVAKRLIDEFGLENIKEIL